MDCEVKMPTIMSSQCWSLLVLKLSKHIYNPGGEGPEDSRREARSRGVEGSLEWRRSVALEMCLVSRSTTNTNAPEENSEEGVEDQLRYRMLQYLVIESC